MISRLTYSISFHLRIDALLKNLYYFPVRPRSTKTPPGYQELFLHRTFTDKPFRTVRPAGLSTWLLIYNIDGEAFYRHPGGEVHTHPGDAILLLPGFVRDYGSTRHGPYTRFFTEFHPRPGWTELLQWPAPAPTLRRLHIHSESTRREIERAFAEGVAFGPSHHARREAFAHNALEKVLLWCDTENPLGQSAGVDPRITRAFDYLTQNLARSVTLPALARYCGLSVSRLSFLFHEATGTSPLHYLETRRLDRARQLLRLTQNPIQAIAAEVGYPDAFYFSLRFKRHTGKCPRAYRRSARQ